MTARVTICRRSAGPKEGLIEKYFTLRTAKVTGVVPHGNLLAKMTIQPEDSRLSSQARGGEPFMSP
jgi:hypothetical protein